jgi:20S proteasome subunit alpha 6
MEAVKQGSVCLGLKSRTHAVLCSLKRLPSELAGYQEKLFKVDDYIGMAMSGLTADARVLCKFMRNECLGYKMTFGANKSLKRLLEKVAESTECPTLESQAKTQRANKRPYGVGLLIAGMDDQGPHIFETCPSGNYY